MFAAVAADGAFAERSYTDQLTLGPFTAPLPWGLFAFLVEDGLGRIPLSRRRQLGARLLCNQDRLADTCRLLVSASGRKELSDHVGPGLELGSTRGV